MNYLASEIVRQAECEEKVGKDLELKVTFPSLSLLEEEIELPSLRRHHHGGKEGRGEILQMAATR